MVGDVLPHAKATLLLTALQCHPMIMMVINKHDGDEQDDDDDGCHPMRIYTSAQPQSLSFKLGSIFAEMGILITKFIVL